MDLHENIFVAALRTIQQRSFSNSYWQTFDVIKADTDELKERAFRLRYDVFVQENNFDMPQEGHRLERDAFDHRAAHFLMVHRDSGEDAGTMRLLLPNLSEPQNSFPLQDDCDHPLLMIDTRIMRLAEISRFCMAKKFRQRPLDGKILPAYYETENKEKSSLAVHFRRRIPYAPLGLLKAAFETALEQNIPDIVTAMDPTQFRSMKQIGLSYRVLGPRINHTGTCQPIVFSIKHVLDNMAMENPECWEIVSDRGRLHKRANILAQNEWHDSIFDQDCRDMIMRKLI